MSISLRILDPSDKTNVLKYPSDRFPQLQQNANNRGKELFEYLYNEIPQPTKPTTLLPPNFAVAPVLGIMEAVPVGDVKVVQNAAAATNEYIAFRTKLYNEFPDKGIEICQRGYGITNARSVRPIIGTTSIAPCIAVLAYRSDTQTAALAHVDAEQNFASLEEMLDLPDFQDVANVELHFYGGMNNYDESRETCYGLLNAVVTINQRRPNFIICAFDVMALPHKASFAFDTRIGKKYDISPHFNYGLKGFLLDSKLRLWPNGNYLAVKDGVAMKHAVEALPGGTPLKAQLDRIRLQWDGTDRLVGFEASVNLKICELIVQKASLPNVHHGVDGTFTTAVIAALRAKKVPIAFEQSLKDWLVYVENPPLDPTSANGRKATDSIVAAVQTVLQANVSVAQRGQDLETALNAWVKAHPHPYEGKY
jgi:hypothetical protein